jgi:hypothetical protein
MEQQNSGFEIKEKIHPDIQCRVCGYFLYSTDQGNHEVTYHCSSNEARFWDFERGTTEQIRAKEHWEESRTEVFAHKDQ